MLNGKENFGLDNLECPSCGVISPSEKWGGTLVGCEQCGDHCAVECPDCKEEFDSVWGYDKIMKENGLLKEKAPILIDKFDGGYSSPI